MFLYMINLCLITASVVRGFGVSSRMRMSMISQLSPDQLTQSLNWRYACKAFDSTKKLPTDKVEALEEALRLSASSYGLQPWKFIIVSDQATKEKLRPASYNQAQITDSSHLVVLTSRSEMTEGDVDNYVNQLVADTGAERSRLDGYRNMMVGSIVKGKDAVAQKEWASKQVYIALGNLLTSAAVLGVDTCALEGIVPSTYDEILGLTGSGYTTVVACALGFRSDTDRNASAKKTRFPSSSVIKRV